MTQPGSFGYDAQHAEFAEAGESDWARSAVLMEDAVVHEPGDPETIMTPEEWDAAGWDNERQQPKTLDEANGALAQRLAMPEAPDNEVIDYEDVELTADQRGDA